MGNKKIIHSTLFAELYVVCFLKEDADDALIALMDAIESADHACLGYTLHNYVDEGVFAAYGIMNHQQFQEG